MKVKAIAQGYFNNQIKEVGMRFECSEEAFSPSWMVALDDKGKVLSEQPKKIKGEIKDAYPILSDEDVKLGEVAIQGDESEEDLVQEGLSIVDDEGVNSLI